MNRDDEYIRDRIARVLNKYTHFLIQDIAAESRASRNHVHHFLAQLIRSGRVRRLDGATRCGRGSVLYERLKPIPGAGKPPIARSRIWRSMRVLRRFHGADLAAVAEAGLQNTLNYVSQLVAAGYLRKVKTETPRHGVEGRAIFALVKDTGPLAPRIAHDGTVTDLNVAEAGGGCGKQSGSRGCAPSASEQVRPRSRG